MKYGLALDIDETLAWTVGAYVRQMMGLFGNPEALTVKELVDKYKYTQNVPYWQTEEARDWMRKQWANDDFQKDLPLIDGSLEYVNKINEIIPIVLYLTLRPGTVENGTKHWLEKHGFPKAPIMSRPNDVSRDAGTKWKAHVLAERYPKLIGIIDDYAEIILHLPDYKGTIFLFDHEKSDSLNAIPCKDWKTVYLEVKKLYIDGFHPSK